MSKPIDLEHLLSIFSDDSSQLVEILDVFIASYNSSMEALKEAANNNDADAWKRAAHTMKGSSGSIGAFEISALFDKIQYQFDADASSNIANLGPIEAEFAKVSAYIEEVRQKYS